MSALLSYFYYYTLPTGANAKNKMKTENADDILKFLCLFQMVVQDQLMEVRNLDTA